LAATKVVNYYAMLNLPPTADLVGVENAYARLSDEFAGRMEFDDTAVDGLRRLNEAYSVLSKPDLRREYDRVFLAAEQTNGGCSRTTEATLLARLMVGTLVAIVLLQSRSPIARG
jgi:curved DNA-binding protein CbpA